MKLTPEDEQAFVKYVEEYQTLLNLNDWRLERSEKPASKGAMAQIAIQMEDRLAVYQIGKDWASVNEKALRQCVVHELLHVWFKPLIYASLNRDEEQVTSLEHGLIVQLEKLLT